MITLHRQEKRQRVQCGMHALWRSFEQVQGSAPPTKALRLITAFDEIQLAPDEKGLPLSYTPAELVTYVYQGALAQQDADGTSRVLQAGEFQILNSKQAATLKHSNASLNRWAHCFQICFLTSTTALLTNNTRRFAAAQRRNVLCLVASRDGRDASLNLHSDACIYSSVLAPGYHLVHALKTGRSAFLHVIVGEVTVLDNVLMTGDSVGVSDEPSVSLISQEPSEILLIDVGPAPRRNE